MLMDNRSIVFIICTQGSKIIIQLNKCYFEQRKSLFKTCITFKQGKKNWIKKSSVLKHVLYVLRKFPNFLIVDCTLVLASEKSILLGNSESI